MKTVGKQEFRRTDFGSGLLAAEGEGGGGEDRCGWGSELQNVPVCANAVTGIILIPRDVLWQLLGEKNCHWRKFFEITADSVPLVTGMSEVKQYTSGSG
jgi:hypothetical protein